MHTELKILRVNVEPAELKGKKKIIAEALVEVNGERKYARIYFKGNIGKLRRLIEEGKLEEAKFYGFATNNPHFDYFVYGFGTDFVPVKHSEIAEVIKKVVNVEPHFVNFNIRKGFFIPIYVEEDVSKAIDRKVANLGLGLNIKIPETLYRHLESKYGENALGYGVFVTQANTSRDAIHIYPASLHLSCINVGIVFNLLTASGRGIIFERVFHRGSKDRILKDTEEKLRKVVKETDFKLLAEIVRQLYNIDINEVIIDGQSLLNLLQLLVNEAPKRYKKIITEMFEKYLNEYEEKAIAGYKFLTAINSHIPSKTFVEKSEELQNKLLLEVARPV